MGAYYYERHFERLRRYCLYYWYEAFATNSFHNIHGGMVDTLLKEIIRCVTELSSTLQHKGHLGCSIYDWLVHDFAHK